MSTQTIEERELEYFDDMWANAQSQVEAPLPPSYRGICWTMFKLGCDHSKDLGPVSSSEDWSFMPDAIYTL